MNKYSMRPFTLVWFAEGIFCSLSTEGGGYQPSLDYSYKASDFYDFGTSAGGQVWALFF